MNLEAVRERFLVALREAGMNQRQFSLKAGVSQSYVSDVMRGAAKPNLEVVTGAVEVLNCSATWLLTGKGKMLLSAHDQVPTDVPRRYLLADLASQALGESRLEQILELMIGEPSAGARSA